MIYVCSDLHFNHLNILKYEPNSRPFFTIEEMNTEIIKRWNETVDDNDSVWVLGDLAMGRIDAAEALLRQLKGHIHVVRGNHDTPARIALYESLGWDVHDIAYLNYKGRFFIMCHFPIASKEFIDMVRVDNSECIILYGHIHHNAPAGYVDGTFHVGLDTNNLTPVSIEYIWQESNKN